MSWSISAGGKIRDAKKQVSKQVKGMRAYPCGEPEEALKKKAVSFIRTVLRAQSADNSVTISACGSATTGSDGKTSQSLNISISASPAA